jgi:hypothetical protein
MAHPARAEYPASTFSAEQMALLQAEPLLEVIITGDPDPAPAKAKG